MKKIKEYELVKSRLGLGLQLDPDTKKIQHFTNLAALISGCRVGDQVVRIEGKDFPPTGSTCTEVLEYAESFSNGTTLYVGVVRATAEQDDSWSDEQLYEIFCAVTEKGGAKWSVFVADLALFDGLATSIGEKSNAWMIANAYYNLFCIWEKRDQEPFSRKEDQSIVDIFSSPTSDALLPDLGDSEILRSLSKFDSVKDWLASHQFDQAKTDTITESLLKRSPSEIFTRWKLDQPFGQSKGSLAAFQHAYTHFQEEHSKVKLGARRRTGYPRALLKKPGGLKSRRGPEGRLTVVVRLGRSLGAALHHSNSTGNILVTWVMPGSVLEQVGTSLCGNVMKILGAELVRIADIDVNGALQKNNEAVLQDTDKPGQSTGLNFVKQLLSRQKRPFEIELKLADYWLQKISNIKYQNIPNPSTSGQYIGPLPTHRDKKALELFHSMKYSQSGFSYEEAAPFALSHDPRDVRRWALGVGLRAGEPWVRAWLARAHTTTKYLKPSLTSVSSSNAMIAIDGVLRTEFWEGADVMDLVRWIVVQISCGKKGYLTMQEVQVQVVETLLSLQTIYLGLGNLENSKRLEPIIQFMTDPINMKRRSTLFGKLLSFSKHASGSGKSTHKAVALGAEAHVHTLCRTMKSGKQQPMCKITPIQTNKLKSVLSSAKDFTSCLLCPCMIDTRRPASSLRVANLPEGHRVHALCAAVLRLPAPPPPPRAAPSSSSAAGAGGAVAAGPPPASRPAAEEPAAGEGAVVLPPAKLAGGSFAGGRPGRACAVCRGAGGALLACAVPRCQRLGHATCALEQNSGKKKQQILFSHFVHPQSITSGVLCVGITFLSAGPFKKMKLASVPCYEGLKSGKCGLIFCTTCIFQVSSSQNPFHKEWSCLKCSKRCPCDDCGFITADNSIEHEGGAPSSKKGDILVPVAKANHPTSSKKKRKAESPSTQIASYSYTPGDKVMVMWETNDKHNNQYYCAMVCQPIKKSSDGSPISYSVLYDKDGTLETAVSPRRIKPFPKTLNKWQNGELVYVEWKARKYLPATILRVQSNGFYTVQYKHNGSVEEDVNPVRLQDQQRKTAAGQLLKPKADRKKQQPSSAVGTVVVLHQREVKLDPKPLWSPDQYVPIVIEDYHQHLIGLQYPEHFSGYGWYTGKVLDVEAPPPPPEAASGGRAAAATAAARAKPQFHVQYCDGNELFRSAGQLRTALVRWLSQEENKDKLPLPPAVKQAILSRLAARRNKAEAAPAAAPPGAAAAKRTAKTAPSLKKKKPQPQQRMAPKGPAAAPRHPRRQGARRAPTAPREAPAPPPAGGGGKAAAVKAETGGAEERAAGGEEGEGGSGGGGSGGFPEYPRHGLYQGPVPILDVTLELLQECPSKFIGTFFHEYFSGYGDYTGKILEFEDGEFLVEYNDGTQYQRAPKKMFSVFSMIKKKAESEVLSSQTQRLWEQMAEAQRAAAAHAAGARRAQSRAAAAGARRGKKRAFSEVKRSTVQTDLPEITDDSGLWTFEDLLDHPDIALNRQFPEKIGQSWNWSWAVGTVVAVQSPQFEDQHPIFEVEYHDGSKGIKTARRLFDALSKFEEKTLQEALNAVKKTQAPSTGSDHQIERAESSSADPNSKYPTVLRWKHGLAVDYEAPLFRRRRLNQYQKFCNSFARSGIFSSRTKRQCLDAANASWEHWKKDETINLFIQKFSPDEQKCWDMHFNSAPSSQPSIIEILDDDDDDK